jgi:hypothetical protein
MNRNARTLLDAVAWASLSIDHADASSVPRRVERLVEAEDQDAVDAAYWQLDKIVVVQGRVFDSALALVPVLLALLGGDLRGNVRARILDLLFEIQDGEAKPDATRDADHKLAVECTRAVRRGLWLYYACFLDADARVRKNAVDLIGQLERVDSTREPILKEVGRSDADPGVRDSANWWMQRDST